LDARRSWQHRRRVQIKKRRQHDCTTPYIPKTVAKPVQQLPVGNRFNGDGNRIVELVLVATTTNNTTAASDDDAINKDNSNSSAL